MSLFYCATCDGLCDADDGCDEAPDGLGLICIDCISEVETEADSLSPGVDA